MATPPLLDTNVLIYAFSDDRRGERARQLLTEPFVVSVQALNEFANVVRRKRGYSWAETRGALSDVVTMAQGVLALDHKAHLRGLDIAERFGLSTYDALMLAVADLAGCTICLSEDMQDGLLIDGNLAVRNPFAAP